MGLLMVTVRGYIGLTKAELELSEYYTIIFFSLWGILVIFMRIAYGTINLRAILRDWLPFYFCILFYEFLHSFLAFINPNDWHELLIQIDYFLFGAHPTVWLQKFIHPALTNYLTTVYLAYFLFLPALATMLYFKRKFFEFRALMLTAIVCLYAGYVGYILVPALPPYMTQSTLYTLTLQGTLADKALFPFLDTTAIHRGCFPSLHTAIITIVLIFACRYEPKLFWLMLPFGLSLFVATVYLRQHYVIDLIAGWILAGGCLYWVPRFNFFWENHIRGISEEMGSIYTSE